VENSIIMKANKVMVARSAGTASVFGYNYSDDGFILGSEGWIEVGVNASHMVGPHHVLSEGNYGFNFDSDKTHGNAIYHTVFRNHLSGIRRDFGDSGSGNGPKRAAGAAFHSYWHSLRRQRARCSGTDGRMGLRERQHGPAGDVPARLGRLGALPRRSEGGCDHDPARQLRLRDQLGEVGSEHHDPGAAELAVPEREAGVLRRGSRLHLAVGRPDRRDKAVPSLDVLEAVVGPASLDETCVHPGAGSDPYWR
jgi:hypothetical protein